MTCFSWKIRPKLEKMYQINANFTKVPWNIPNGLEIISNEHKIYVYHHFLFQGTPNWDFCMKLCILSGWLPWLRTIYFMSVYILSVWKLFRCEDQTSRPSLRPTGGLTFGPSPFNVRVTPREWHLTFCRISETIVFYSFHLFWLWPSRYINNAALTKVNYVHMLKIYYWGRCYDHNFLLFFCQFSVKKWRFSQKPMLWSDFCKN
jgi:hypothetical protein